MSTTKITDLPILTTPSANAENTVFVVVDKSSGTFTTKQLSLANLDSFVDNVGPIAFTHANAAFNAANSANSLAQNAYNAANSANTFDYTTISTTAGVYGNSTFIPVITLVANGRISSVTNTAITGFANATYDQAGFDKANSANVLAQSAFDKANSANVLAQNAYNAANTNGSVFNTAAFDKANSANVLAQAAFDKANTSNTTADSGFDKANSANVLAQSAFDKANSANVLAQAAFNSANSANTFDYTTISTTAGVYGNATFVPVITLAANGRVSSITNTAITGFANATHDQAGFDHANGAFTKANSANVLAQNAYDYANTISISLNNAYITASRNTANGAYDHANGAFLQANTALTTAALSFNSGNTTQTTANASFNHANGAFDKANSANVIAQSSYNFANTTSSTVTLSYNHANAAFDKANSANVIAQSSYNFANTVDTYAQSAYATTNTNSTTISNVSIHANGAFNAANTALATALIAINYDNYANAAFDKANSANVLAQAAFDSANSSNTFDYTTISTTAGVYGNATFVPVITLAANGRVSSITNTAISGLSYDHANGAFTAANVTSNIALSFSATTILDVSNNGTSAYRFGQYGAVDNPNVSTFSATTLGFNLSALAGSHPFHIRLGDNSADFNTGLVHVSTTGTLSYESSAQGQTSGTLFWRIPNTSVGNYKYRCSAHPGAMIGNINIANTANIYFAYST